MKGSQQPDQEAREDREFGHMLTTLQKLNLPPASVVNPALGRRLRSDRYTPLGSVSRE